MEKATPHIWTPAKADAVLDEMHLLLKEGRALTVWYKTFLIAVIIFIGLTASVLYINGH